MIAGSRSGPKWSLARWTRENWKIARNAHGPEKQEILLGDIPLDVLPLLPTAYSEIDEYGTYRVRQNGQFIGTAIYSGPAEWNRAENICHFGTKTIFRPARPLETTVIEFLTDESDGENT
jgi:hypothetical protein